MKGFILQRVDKRYEIDGVPVRVKVHRNVTPRYIVGYRDTERYATTLSEAEYLIRARIIDKLAKDRNNELSAYASLRETGFTLSVPAAVYGES